MGKSWLLVIVLIQCCVGVLHAGYVSTPRRTDNDTIQKLTKEATEATVHEYSPSINKSRHIDSGKNTPAQNVEEVLTTSMVRDNRHHPMTKTPKPDSAENTVQPIQYIPKEYLYENGDGYERADVTLASENTRMNRFTDKAETRRAQGMKEIHNTGAVDYLKTTTTKIPPTFRVHGSIEQYTCSIVIEGHWNGITDKVMSVIHYVLVTEDTGFGYDKTLYVRSTASTYEVIDDGSKVTRINYFVSYDGHVLREREVTQVMSKPHVTQKLKSKLSDNHLKLHAKASKQIMKPTSSQSWAQDNVAIVIALSCVIVALLTMTIILIRLSRKKIAMQSEKKRPLTSAEKTRTKLSKKLAIRDVYDNGVSVANPAFDFEKGVMGPESMA